MDVNTRRLRKGSTLQPGQDFLLWLYNATMDDDETKKHFYAGYSSISTLFTLYLIRKYGGKCVVRNDFMVREKHKFGMYISFDLLENSTLRDTTPPEAQKGLRESLAECLALDPPMVVLPLTMRIAEQKEHGLHANMVIYRPATATFEHFEPHGEYFYNSAKLGKGISDKLRQVFEAIHPGPFTFVTSNDVCPANVSKGLQSIEQNAKLGVTEEVEGGGYCAAWSMFFAEMCLRNPTLSSREVFGLIVDFLPKTKNQDKNVLRHIVHSYSRRMGKVLFQYYRDILNHSGVLDATTETRKYGKVQVQKPIPLTEANMMHIMIRIMENMDLWRQLKIALQVLVEIEADNLANRGPTRRVEDEKELANEMKKLGRLMEQAKVAYNRAGQDMDNPGEFVPPTRAPEPALPTLPIPPEAKERIAIVHQKEQQLRTKDLPRLDSKVAKYANPNWWTRMTKNVNSKLSGYQTQRARVTDELQQLEQEVAALQQQMDQAQQAYETAWRQTQDAQHAANVEAARQAHDALRAKWEKRVAALQKLKAAQDEIAVLHFSKKQPEILGGRRETRRHQKNA